MGKAQADQIRHWLAVADGEDSDEKKLAARYTAAAAARLWVLDELGKKSDAPDSWGQVQELADEADKHLDADEQDEALYRRAQSNVLALRLFEESGENSSESKDSDDDDDDKDDDKDDGDTDEKDEKDEKDKS
jgi:hypothetical protein